MKKSDQHILKIAIDCRDLQIAKTGSKTYLNELLNAFRLSNFTDVRIIEIHPTKQLEFSNTVLGKIKKHFSFLIWKQIILPFKAVKTNADILLCTDYFLPSIKWGLKHVVVFHDAFFWEYSAHYNRFWLKLFHYWAVPSAKRADAVIVPSNHVKKKLEDFMGIVEDHLKVVYEAPKIFEHTTASVNTENAFMHLKPYLLHVGGFNKHKNLPRLVNAFREAITGNSENWHLVLVGGRGSSAYDDDTAAVKKLIEKYKLQNRVHLTGYVNDDILQDYYLSASGYVFPSYNEGFGLPILEAMKFGLPVAAANNTCLPEIAGDAAIYFDPFNINEMVVALEKIMLHHDEINHSIGNHSLVLKRYSWERSALEITDICRALAD